MSGGFKKSWSFFGPRRPHSDDYLGQHYQPNSPNIRVNLQHRFSEGRHDNMHMKWRARRPLPPLPPPTRAPGQSSQYPEENVPRPMPRHKSFDFNRLGTIQSHYSNIENIQCPQNHDPKLGNAARSSFPRRPLQELPSGVAPIWSTFQENVNQLKPQTSKILHKGGKKMNRALQGVRTSFSAFTQIFRNSTRRRYKLDGGGTPTHTPRRTPARPVRQTPGKLYTPFDVSTPRTPYSFAKGPKRLQTATPRRIIYGNENRAMIRTPQHPSRAPPNYCQWNQFHSPSQNFEQDVTAMNQGMGDLERVSNVIVANTTGRWMQYR
ncbi:hypothetical protein SK128_018985 [Halocaridina rubra]|uniref:Uncharacterized protein n=1 Tax=Halocaridina rubra TaxID=373956 RepID=A0AAN9A553_HALRR